MDLISCIITTYKRPISILKRAIDSIVSQTYKNIELIIVNDAPQDTELEEEIKNLLDEYKTIPIVYIVNNKNMGACYSRNTGITKARGKFIAFLDDDDEWLPTKLKKQYELMIKADVDLVYCSHYEVYRNGKIKLIEECLSKEGKNTDDFERLLCENFIGSTSYPLIKLESIKNIGGFNVDLKSSQDYELWLRFTKKYDIAYLREPLVKYHLTKGSISDNMENKIQGFEYILSEFKNEYLDNKIIYNYKLNYLAFICLKKGNIKYFLYYYTKAIRIIPFTYTNFLIINKLIKRLAYKK